MGSFQCVVDFSMDALAIFIISKILHLTSSALLGEASDLCDSFQ